MKVFQKKKKGFYHKPIIETNYESDSKIGRESEIDDNQEEKNNYIPTNKPQVPGGILRNRVIFFQENN